MSQQIDLLVFDLSNLAYISAFRHRAVLDAHEDKPKILKELCLQDMRYIYRLFRPKQVLFAFDHLPYWRSEIFPEYKANREDHPTKRWVRAAMEDIRQSHADLSLYSERCEADDIIYAVTRYHPGLKLIVSSDRDFLQLVGPEVRLFNPLDRQFRSPGKKPEFELFLKCIRGDRIDNIPSACPRVTLKVLQKAFQQPNHFEQLMQTKLLDGRLVREQYELNRNLIDLTRVPSDLSTQLDMVLAKRLKPVLETTVLEGP